MFDKDTFDEFYADADNNSDQDELFPEDLIHDDFDQDELDQEDLIHEVFYQDELDQEDLIHEVFDQEELDQEDLIHEVFDQDELDQEDLIHDDFYQEELDQDDLIQNGFTYSHLIYNYQEEDLSSDEEDDFKREFNLLEDNPIAKHSYLGVEFTDISYRNFFKPYERLELLNIYRELALCVPGQRILITIPFSMTLHVQEHVSKKESFVLTNKESLKHSVAVVIDPEYTSFWNNQLVLICIGRQRVELANVNSVDLESRNHAKISLIVLPEIGLSQRCPLSAQVIPKSFQKWSNDEAEFYKHNHIDFEVPNASMYHRPVAKLPMKTQVLHNFGNINTSSPGWVYVTSDIHHLVRNLRRQLDCHNSQWKEKSFSSSFANSYSYWLIHSLPLSLSEKNHLLSLDTAVERITRIISQIKTYTGIICTQCHSDLSKSSDILKVSSDNESIFINPSGSIFDLIIFKNVEKRNVRTIGSYSSGFSWFPGYSWKILNCKRCFSHLGWKFHTEDEALNPKSFYAMRKDYIDQKIRSELDQNQSNEAVQSMTNPDLSSIPL